MDNKKISNTEWGLVIGALLLVDIIQLILDLIPYADIAFAVVNELADVFVGLAWGLYVNLRVNKVDWKKILTQIVAFFGKEASAGGLPLWCLEGVTIFSLQKFDEHAEKLGFIGQVASQALHSQAGAAGVTGETAPEAPTAGDIAPATNTLSSLEQPNHVVDLRSGGSGSSTRPKTENASNTVDLSGNTNRDANPLQDNSARDTAAKKQAENLKIDADRRAERNASRNQESGEESGDTPFAA